MIELVAALSLLLPVVTVTSQPGWARVYAKEGEAWKLRGRTPLKLDPKEPLEIELRYSGKDTESLVVDGTRDVHVCFDDPGQLVTCERIFRTGMRPKSVAFRPGSDELWVALFAGPPALQVFDLVTGQKIASIRAGKEGAIEMVFTRDGKTLYASQLEASVVLEVDTESKTVRRSIPVGGQWPKVLELSPNEKQLYVSNWRTHDVSEIDLEKGSLARRIKTTKVPRGLHATKDGRLFVAGYYKGELDVVDLKSEARKTIYNEGDSLRHLTAAPDGTLYLSDMGTYDVMRVDPAKLVVEKFVRTDPNPNTIAVTPDGKLLMTSSRGQNAGSKGKRWLKPGPTWGSVNVFDLETGEKLDAIIAGNQTTGLAISPDGTRVAFTDFLDNRVRVHRIPSLKRLREGPGRAKVYRRELRKKDYEEPE